MIERVHRYKEKESLFESSGVEKEIASTLDRRVDLPSGGYLVFDYAEAFTVIDVNTGRFVGSRSKNSNQRLEDTITKNNLEAVKEVVRQLRLRDIGGIIVIDFIDMANPKNRASVEDALRQELERDRTKTYVVEISPLGLVEMTRQNVTDGPREILTRKCPTCAGDGIVVSDHTVAMQIERKLRPLPYPATASRRTRWPCTHACSSSSPAAAALAWPRSRRPPGAASSSCLRKGTSTQITSRSSPRASWSTCSRPRRSSKARPSSSSSARSGVRRNGSGRQDRGRRRSRRRCGEARRQEGDRHDRARARRPGVRDDRRRRRGRRGADHVRERGREADACSRQAQADRTRRTSKMVTRRRRRDGRPGGRRRILEARRRGHRRAVDAATMT